MEGLWDPKLKGIGNCEGTTCPKALVLFTGFPSSIGSSLRKRDVEAFSPDEDLTSAPSKLTGLLEAGTEKDCFSSTVAVDPKFEACGFVSEGLLKEKGRGVAEVTDVEDNSGGAKAEPEEDVVAVFSRAGSIFCGDLSSERLGSSPSQKGFSASLTGWDRTEGTGSVEGSDAVKFNTRGRAGAAGAVFARS